MCLHGNQSCAADAVVSVAIFHGMPNQCCLNLVLSVAQSKLLAVSDQNAFPSQAVAATKDTSGWQQPCRHKPEHTG